MGKAITKAKEIAAEAPQTAEKTKGGEVITKAKETATAAENESTAATVEQAPAVTLDELEGMDMSVFGQDETEAEDAPRPAWRITDDGCADWACRRQRRRSHGSRKSWPQQSAGVRTAPAS